jgi:putative membrane protein
MDMQHLARLSAFGGLVLAIVIFIRNDVAAIVVLLAQAGFGLLLASLLHVLPMLLNARAWQAILPAVGRPSLLTTTWLVWIRESVNGLLPVARVGGELLSYRLLRRYGMDQAWAASSLVVDMTLAILSQCVFAAFGLGLLIWTRGSTSLAFELSAGVAVTLFLGMLFIWLQRAGLFKRVTRLVDKLVTGRLEAVVEHSARLDRAIRAIYLRRAKVASCLIWQCAGWLAGSAEIWAALRFMGRPLDWPEAVAIEALIQAVSSAAFVVPGALGVQEGGFVLIGTALGVDAPTSLALAAARRIRDLVVYFPGLVAWQWAERKQPRPDG